LFASPASRIYQILVFQLSISCNTQDIESNANFNSLFLLDNKLAQFSHYQSRVIKIQTQQQVTAMQSRPPLPPFTAETAALKVKAAEDAWNSRNPQAVALAYTPDCQWRNRNQFIRGRGEIEEFLTNKWQSELDYKLEKTLWSFSGNRIAVTFIYEWHDVAGDWVRSYGNELWEFNSSGLMQQRIASINDLAIEEEERELR